MPFGVFIMGAPKRKRAGDASPRANEEGMHMPGEGLQVGHAILEREEFEHKPEMFCGKHFEELKGGATLEPEGGKKWLLRREVSGQP